jgi:glycerol kinase
MNGQPAGRAPAHGDLGACGYVLGVDQGTSGTVALILDERARVVAVSQAFPTAQSFPRPGWAEIDPASILRGVQGAIASVLGAAGVPTRSILGCGLANQGETVIAFDRRTGEPVYPAITWQDRRGEEYVGRMRDLLGPEAPLRTTGLIPSTYFSAPKIRWLLDNVEEARRLASQGRLCAGTTDAWILSQLLKGSPCVTDVSTASRTLLFDIGGLRWDERLLDAFSIPASALPEVRRTSEAAGVLSEGLLGAEVPVAGLCVDQQAALFGHGCHRSGETKITYGTGAFVLSNLGTDPGVRPPGLLTSVAWSLGGETRYAADGGIYCAGSLVRWLIDGPGLARTPEEIEAMVEPLPDAGGVSFVPALAGLAAPHWMPEAAASWHGMRLSTTRAQLARAAVESIAFRVKTIVDVLASGPGISGPLRVDGGMSGSRFLMQYQADLLGRPLAVYKDREATALGAALLAGVSAGLWDAESLRTSPAARNYVEVLPDPGNARPRESYEQWMEVLRITTGL